MGRLIKIDLVPTLVWRARLAQLKEGIKQTIYEPLKMYAIQEAYELAQAQAPLFNAAEYTSPIWQYYFQKYGTPTPGALRSALVFDEMTDCHHNDDGYILGFGDIDKLGQKTANYDIFGGMMLLGGKNAGHPERIRANQIVPLPNEGFGSPIPMTNMEIFTAYKISDMGYWYGMEFGMKGKTHFIPGRGFMSAGHARILTRWIELVQSHALLRSLAMYWNNNEPVYGLK